MNFRFLVLGLLVLLCSVSCVAAVPPDDYLEAAALDDLSNYPCGFDYGVVLGGSGSSEYEIRSAPNSGYGLCPDVEFITPSG